MSIRSPEELARLLRVGRLVRSVLAAMKRRVEPGVTTAELDSVAEGLLRRAGARSAPQDTYGFPGVACISVNQEAVHGVPGKRRIEAGDLVKLDVTAELDGLIADSAITVPVPPVTEDDAALCETAREALQVALSEVRAELPLNAIGAAIERTARARGATVLRDLCSHGVGRAIHEPPTIPNHYVAALNQPLPEGLVITIEPILSSGSAKVETAADGWTIESADGSSTAHFEHTLVVTESGPLVVT